MITIYYHLFITINILYNIKNRSGRIGGCAGIKYLVFSIKYGEVKQLSLKIIKSVIPNLFRDLPFKTLT